MSSLTSSFPAHVSADKLGTIPGFTVKSVMGHISNKFKKTMLLKFSEDRLSIPLRVLVLLVLMMGIGCADRQIDNAFEGEFDTVKGNKIITEYCQSCHIHKNFDPDSHIPEAQEKYRRPYFRRTSQCRSCHYVKRDWVHNKIERNTRFPRDANRGKYRKFEKKEMSRYKKG
jgi:hypothetical protein